VLEIFLSRGVDVNIKNARGHTPLHLATEPNVRELILRAVKTLKCLNCSSIFDFKNVRYYCLSCYNFYCLKCSKTQWVYERTASVEKNRLVCRCHACAEKVKKSEHTLQEAMNSMDYHIVDREITEI
jgi:ankyrin repeat protein